MAKPSRMSTYVIIIVIAAALAVASYFSYQSVVFPSTRPQSIAEYPVVVVKPLNPFVRHGDAQLIEITVLQQGTNQRIERAFVQGEINFPDGKRKVFSGLTDSQGSLQATLPIPDDAPMGDYNVKAVVNAPSLKQGIGQTTFRITDPAIKPQPKYNGTIAIEGRMDKNNTVAIIRLQFIPPTESGIILFTNHPDGKTTKTVVADPGTKITAISPSVQIDAAGRWKFWAVSGGKLSDTLPIDVK